MAELVPDIKYGVLLDKTIFAVDYICHKFRIRPEFLSLILPQQCFDIERKILGNTEH